MTTREKAKELVDRFSQRRYTDEDSKECALICVDEMLKELGEFSNDDGYQLSRVDYLKEVKQEINKL